MQIGHKLINSLSPPLVVAEISCNHNQNIYTARKLIRQAKYCGCDAVKFQHYLPHHVTLEPELLEIYHSAHMPFEWTEELVDLCNEVDIMWWSSVFDPEAVDFLEKFRPIAYKLASFELNHFPLLEKLKSTGKPLIISTGMMNYSDLNWFQIQFSAMNTMLLHCVSNYPSDVKDFNLATITAMKEQFGFEVGLSDHTRTLGVSIASVALGARMIERHFTLKRNGGLDDEFSLEPDEMERLCVEVRNAYDSMGTIDWSVKGATEYKRSLYATMDIKKGDNFNDGNIGILRPNRGINAKEWYRFVKGRAREDIKKGTPLHYRHME